MDKTDKIFNIYIILLVIILIVILLVGYIPSAKADNFQFLKDIYQTQQDWKAYGNKISPAYYNITWGGGTYSTNFVNNGVNVGGGYSGTLSGGDDVQYSFAISQFVQWDGTYSSGNAQFEDSSFANPANWSSVLSELDSQPYAVMPLSIECGTTYSNYSGYGLNLATGWIVYFGVGDCYLDGRDNYPMDCEWDDTCSTPTPTPGQSPTPTPTPGQSPTPTPTPHVYPIPSVTMVPDVEVGQLDGEFSYDANTGMGTISVTVKLDQEMVDLPEDVYEVGTGTMSSDLPMSDGSETGDVVEALEDYMQYGSSTLHSVSGGYFQPVVNWMIDSVFNHPVMALFNNIDFQLNDALCSLTVNIYGTDITIGFCDLEDELALLRIIIIGVAGVYSVFIVLKGD